MTVYDTSQLNYKDTKFCEEAFNAFYDDYYQRIYNYIFFSHGNRFIAEDLTCTVMEKILKNIYKYDVMEASLNTWIFAIVKHTLIDFYRLKSNQNTYICDEEWAILDTKNPGVEEVTIKMEQQRTIAKMLTILPERERTALVLKFWGRLRSSEIAVHMDIEEGNVNVIVFRALKKLKKYIDTQNIVW